MAIPSPNSNPTTSSKNDELRTQILGSLAFTWEQRKLSELAEQKKIHSLFSGLGHIITFHQCMPCDSVKLDCKEDKIC